MPSSSTGSLPEPTFFTDRDLGRTIPERLAEAGISVVAHDDRFAQNTTDVEWLEAVSRKGWVVLSRNRKIRYTRLETDTLMAHGVRCFFLIGSKRTSLELADNVVASMPKIRRFLARHEAPFMAKIYKPPRVEMWLTEEEWQVRPSGS